MLVNSRKLSESIVSSDGCRLLDRAGANDRLSLLSPFGRDGRAGASEGKGAGLGEGESEESLRAVGACGCYNPLTSILSPYPRGEAGRCRRGWFPCRSYGAWIDLAKSYKHVASNGALHRLELLLINVKSHHGMNFPNCVFLCFRSSV